MKRPVRVANQIRIRRTRSRAIPRLDLRRHAGNRGEQHRHLAREQGLHGQRAYHRRAGIARCRDPQPPGRAGHQALYREPAGIRACHADDALARAVAENLRARRAPLPHAVTIDLDGVSVRAVDIEGLLKTKQSARDKDKLDRLVLERALAELGRK